jgi:hypothetical protein
MSRRHVCAAGSPALGLAKPTEGTKAAARRPEAGKTPGSDVEDSISILIALARLYPDTCWHQLLLWFFNRLREKPLEVSHSARLLPRLFRQIGQESIAAIPRTVPLLAEPPASTGNEPNATIAIWI